MSHDRHVALPWVNLAFEEALSRLSFLANRDKATLNTDDELKMLCDDSLVR